MGVSNLRSTKYCIFYFLVKLCDICSAPEIFQRELTACRQFHVGIFQVAKARSASGQPHRGFPQENRDEAAEQIQYLEYSNVN